MKIIIYIFIFLLLGRDVYSDSREYLRPFEIEWESVEGASQYEVEISSLNKMKNSFKKITTSSSLIAQIQPGRYQFRLRAFDRRKVPGDWSPFEEIVVPLKSVEVVNPQNQIKIQNKQREKNTVVFSWKKVPLAQEYEIEVSRLDGFRMNKRTNTLSLEIDLDVGHPYQWTIKAKNSELDLVSLDSQLFLFEHWGSQLEKPEISKPENLFVRNLTWSSVEKNKNYQVKVFKKLKTGWKKITELNQEKNSLDIPLEWSGGHYQVQIIAKGLLRSDSPVAVRSFQLINGDRSPAAEFQAELRKGIDRISGWYGSASYLVSQIDYSSRNIIGSISAKTQFATLSGTGRLGIGYLSPQSPWGFVSSFDYSGMISQSGKNVTFGSLELVGVYRTQLSYRDDMRLKFGLYFKELPFPEVDTQVGNVMGYGNIGTSGLTLGAEYWYTLSPKLGFQIHSYLYNNFESPLPSNSGKLLSTTSYQLGLLGSYRINQKTTGLLGIASRVDSVNFENQNSQSFGVSNFIKLEGLYLNLFLEHGF